MTIVSGKGEGKARPVAQEGVGLPGSDAPSQIGYCILMCHDSSSLLVQPYMDELHNYLLTCEIHMKYHMMV